MTEACSPLSPSARPVAPRSLLRRAAVAVLHLLLAAALPTVPMAGVLGAIPAAAQSAEPAKASAKQRVLILRADGNGVPEAQRQSVTRELQTQARQNQKSAMRLLRSL